VAEPTRLEQEYASLLQKIVADLRMYDGIEDEDQRDALVQQVIARIELTLEDMEPGTSNGQLVPKRQAETHDVALVNMHNPPPPPEKLISFGNLYIQLKNRLLDKIQSNRNSPLVLEGTAGCGKSALAAALARDPEIQSHFPDGIFWFNLGHYPDLLRHADGLLHALNKAPPSFLEVEQAIQYMEETLLARSCLLILDEAWDIQDVGAFKGLGPKCHWIITTHTDKLTSFIKYMDTNALEFKVPALEAAQAIEYFKGNGEVAAIDRMIVNACQGLPLALRMAAGAVAADATREKAELLERFNDRDLDASPDYPEILAQTLHVYMEALGEQADYYLVCAVGGDYSNIPETVVAMLWKHMFQLNDKQIEELIAEFSASGLLRVHGQAPHRYFSLHYFQHEYIREYAELEKLHMHVLAAYRRQCQQGWVNGPNDGYFFDHLCMHLSGGRRDQEQRTLLVDFDWLQKKLEVSTLYSLLNDYAYALDMENSRKDKDLEAIRGALLSASPELLKNPAKLAHEFLNQLWQSRSRDIQAMLNQAKEIEPNWEAPFPDMDDR
jgi:hypothetical protein